MNEYSVYTTGRLSDSTIVDLFNAIRSKFGFSAVSYRAVGIQFPPESVGDLFGEKESYVLNDCNIVTDGSKFTVYYRRGTSGRNHDGNLNIHQRIPSPFLDEIILHANHNNQNAQARPSPEDCVDLDAIILQHQVASVPHSVAGGSNDAIALLQSEMAALTKFHRKMLADAERQRTSLESDYQARRDALHKEEATIREDMERRAADQKAKLDSLQDELNDAKRAVDDRNYMHVRRELRERISGDIEKRVSKALVPRRSAYVNWAVLLFALACAGGAGIFAYESFQSFIATFDAIQSGKTAAGSLEWLAWTLAGRGMFASIVALGFLIYSLSWMRKTYLDDVKTSNDLQRYALDINRASWAIETILEMAKAGNSAIPDKWIEGVCHGLFRAQVSDHREVSPLEAWGTLLNISGKAEFGPEGPKLEFQKGQAKKIAQNSDGK